MADIHSVVMTTCADSDAAKTIAKALVERQLAACVQMLPIDSVYSWNGQIEEAQEILLIVKIKSADYAEVEKAIRALHAYETPEIIALPIVRGFDGYLDWIDKVTRPKPASEDGA